MWNVLRLYIHLYHCINWKNNKLTLYGYTVIKKLVGLRIVALVLSLIQAILQATFLTIYFYRSLVNS